MDEYKEFDKITDAIEERIDNGETVSGREAAMWLAAKFAGQTHGNYDGWALWHRAQVEGDFAVSVARRREPPDA